MERTLISEEQKLKVIELRNKGFTREEIASEIGITFNHVRYIISRLPKASRKWYRKERATRTDSIPNPFPKWWCDKHNIDRNFYRPDWKD